MRPAFRIEVDGKDRSVEWQKRLVSLTICDEAGVRSDSLEAEFDDREDSEGRISAPPIGAEIQVWLGYEPTPVYMGRYKIDQWTKRGPLRTLGVSAKAAELTSSFRAPKTRSWDDTTVGDIVARIAGEHDLTSVVAAKMAAIAINHIDQQNESDMGFLSRLAQRSGATFKPADGKLLFAEKGSANLPSGAASPVLALSPAALSNWTAESQHRGTYGAAKCTYMDHAKGQRVTVTEGSGEPVYRDRRTYATEAEARAAARANIGDLTRGKLLLETEGEGLPNVFAEALIQATDFDPDVDGEFLIKSVRHAFSASGFTTSISMESRAGATVGNND